MTNDEVTKFEKEGIKFSRIPVERSEEVCHFLDEHFLKDEPLSKSIGIPRNWFADMFFTDPIKTGASTMATDKEGKIIGVRLANVYSRNSWYYWFEYFVLCKIIPLFSWLLNHPWNKVAIVFPELYNRLDMDIWKQFNTLHCDKIYNAVLICTKASSRTKGLGTAMLKYSEQIGVEEGCGAALGFTTGIYSERMFRNNGYTEMSQVLYEDFRDKNGKRYLEDTGVHVAATFWTKKIKE